VLQEDKLHVLLGELGALERAHQEDVRVGAARNRDALALEVLDLGDRAVLAGDERGPLGARVDVDGLDGVAVDPADERRRAGSRAEVDGAGVEELERLVGAERLDPAHADAVLRKLLLEEALVLQEKPDGIVGGVVDADLLRGLRESGPGDTGRDGGGEEKAARQVHEKHPRVIAQGMSPDGPRKDSGTPTL
jgi:hypothetical protein